MHLEVVYYKSTMGSAAKLLRHVCSFGSDSAVVDEPGGPTEGRVLWPHGDVLYSLHLFFVWVRGSSWSHAIENLVATEAAANHGSTTFSRELAALKRAQIIILLVDDQTHRVWRGPHFTKMLRADLVAAGRDPDTIPVVFQIYHPHQEGVPTSPTSDIVPGLTWARCDHLESFPGDKRGMKEALDRAIALYEEMRADHEAK
ncbi:hypothetical protein WMF27_27895 [Sorangium sp. So ce281]|uniref:hypothetical protein n=1 Tax=unclassified Sorangium TaxID=2621164 RepID=UPI003F62A2AB